MWRALRPCCATGWQPSPVWPRASTLSFATVRPCAAPWPKRQLAQHVMASGRLRLHRPDHLRHRCRQRDPGLAAAAGGRGARRGAGTGRRAACQPPFFPYLAQHNADFLIAVKHSRRRGFQVIRDRLTYGRRLPWRARKHGLAHGRAITWTLRAMPAPEWVVEHWPGSATDHRRPQPGHPGRKRGR